MLASLPMGGCATGGAGSGEEAAYEAANDPAEGLNRGIFTLNRGVDTMVLKPAATAYRDLLPPPVQSGMHNFLNNLRSPIILLHDLLQGEVERAGDTVVRFVINSTVGILGLRDQASEWGIPFHDEDFGQTLAVWGLGEGPYVMLPLLGPSNPRDTVGTVVDFLIDPINLLASSTGNESWVYARSASAAVDDRAAKMQALDDLEAMSVDFYSATRSAYRQNRDWEIANGDMEALPPGPSPDLDLSDFDAPEPELAALPPADAPPAEAAPVEEPGETLVPLAVYDSYEAALTGWETLAALHPAILAKADPVFTEEPATEGAARIRLLAALPEAVPPAEAKRLVASLALEVPAAAPVMEAPAAEPSVFAAPARPAVPVAGKKAGPSRAVGKKAPRAPPLNLVAVIPAEPPAPPSTRLHLASYGGRVEAETAWDLMAERYGDSLGNASPGYEEVTVGSRTYVRLMAVLPMVAEEAGLCARLQADSAFCRVVAD